MQNNDSKFKINFYITVVVFSFSFFVFSLSEALAATESIAIIREDCSQKSIPTANCYTSLSAWEAGEQRDLVASDEIATAKIEGTWTNSDTTAVTIDGWTTDATRYVKIYTTAEARHDGVWNSNAYRLEHSNASAGILIIREDYTRVNGLQISNLYTGATANRYAISLDYGGAGIVGSQISNNLMRGNNGSVEAGIYGGSGNQNNKVWNNVVYNIGGTAFSINVAGVSGIANELYNNTAVNCGTGFVGVADYKVNTIAQNNIAIGCSVGWSNSWDASSSNNASYDSTHPGSSGVALTSNIVTDYFNSSSDLHINSSATYASQIIDAGLSVSGTFTTDIDGETRSGTWDIGADEYAGTPPPTCTSFIYSGWGTCQSDSTQTQTVISSSPSGCTGGTPTLTQSCTYTAPTDTTNPTLQITSPTTNSTYSTSNSSINLSGTSSDDTSVSTVAWVCQSGCSGSGNTSGTTSWSVSNIALTTGSNIIQVTATDSSGNTATDSITISYTISTDTTSPTIPTNLQATTLSSSQISLSWTASTDAVGVTGYTIYRNSTLLTTTSNTSYTDSGLTPSTLYTYRVSATDGINTSSQSSSVSATTGAVTAPSGNVYYVSPTGSATWMQCANINTPCSPQTSMTNAIAGDTVYFRGGQYELYYDESLSISWWWTRAILRPANSGTAANPIIFAAYLDEIPVLNCHTSAALTFTDRCTAIGVVETSYVTFDGFIVQADDGTKMGRVWIWGGDTTSYGVTLKNTVIYGGTTVGISTDNREGIRADSTDGMLIQNVKVYNFRQVTNWHNTSCYKGYINNNLVIENSEFFNCSTAIYLKREHDNTTIRYNYIHDNDEGIHVAAYLSNNNDNAKIRHNVFANNTQYALVVFGEDGAVTNNFEINNNTIYGPSLRYGIYISEGANWKVWNNIIQGHPDRQYATGYSNIQISESDHNQFGSASLRIQTHLWSGPNFTSLSSWQSSGQLSDGANPGAGSLASDPLFINTSGNMSQFADFELANNSPSKGTGRNGTDMGANICAVGVNASCSTTYTPPQTDTTPPTTTATPTAGTYTGAQTVTLTINESGTTYYTTDGGAPLAPQVGGQATPPTYVYTSPISINQTTTLRFFSVDSSNNSEQTNTQTYTINLPDTTSPQITTPSVNTTQSSATITFTTNESTTSYIDYGLDTTYGTQTNSSTGTTHSFTLPTLSDNTIYNYRITGADSATNQTQSINYTFTTNQAPTPDITPPAQTTNLASTNITQTSANLTWSAPGDDNNTGTASNYDIRYSTTPLTEANYSSATAATGEPTPSTAGQTETVYISVGLAPSTTYYFALKTTDEANNTSTLSNIATLTTLNTQTTPTPTPTPTTSGGGGGGGIFTDTTAPTQTTNTTLQPADSQVTLTWNNPTDTDYVRTMVVRKQGSAPTSRTDGEVVYEGTGVEYTDINLDNTQTYYYAIYTYDRKPNYSQPILISAKPQAGVTAIETVAPTPTTPQTPTQQTITLPPLTGPFSLGMDNAQVKLLQQYLATDTTIYPEGLTTGYYGTLTRKAVERFQIKYNIVSSGSPSTTGFGLAGPRTRAKIQEVLGTTTAPTQRRSNLTQPQVDSIINLLRAFGVEQEMIDRVRAVL